MLAPTTAVNLFVAQAIASWPVGLALAPAPPMEPYPATGPLPSSHLRRWPVEWLHRIYGYHTRILILYISKKYKHEKRTSNKKIKA